MSSSKRSKKQVVAVCGLVVGIPAIVIAANQVGSSTSSIDWSNSNLSKNHLFVGDGNFTNDSSSRHLSVGYGNVNYSDDNALIGTYLINGGNQNGSNSSSLVAGQYNEHVPGAAFTVGTGYYSFYTGNFRRNSFVVKKDGTVESGPLTVDGSPVLTRESLGSALTFSPTGFAGGQGTVATGNQSIAFGEGAQATGDQASAFGLESEASGEFSFAVGNDTRANGDGSVAFGESSRANGNYAVAGGLGVMADGYAATAFGRNTIATGNNSFAAGLYSKAYGVISGAFGLSTTANGRSQFVVGENNTPMGNPLDTQTVDVLFIVGNGTHGGARSNALEVRKNGSTTMKGKAIIEGGAEITGLITIERQGDILMGAFGDQ